MFLLLLIGFPSFLNYGGLLIVTLLGNSGSCHQYFNVGVVVCAMLLLLWSLFV